jgi:hypothetical protein
MEARIVSETDTLLLNIASLSVLGSNKLFEGYYGYRLSPGNECHMLRERMLYPIYF